MRVNREIRAQNVRVIAEDGQQLGLMTLQEALQKAEDRKLDLVEIAPNASPPVCKIIDYGKFMYKKTKKQRESKKQQHQVKIKEIKLRPNIDIHDLNTKINHAKDFLKKGNKVKFTCIFKGRQMLHLELGKKLLNKVFEELEGFATVETNQKLFGRFLTFVVSPKVQTVKKQKTEKTVKKVENNEKNENK